MKAFLIADNTDYRHIANQCNRLHCGIEVQSFYDPEYIVDHRNAINQHREAIENIRPLALHGPFGDLSAGSFDREIRNVTRMRLEQAIQIAGQLGIHNVVLHHGYIPGTNSPSGWLKRFAAFWQNLLRIVPDTMQIHLENVLEQDTELISEVIFTIGDRRVDICLDIGHAHCHGQIPVAEWVRRLSERIGYVHLHNNHGDTDEHLALDTGTLDVAEVLEALEQHAPNALWSLEASGPDQIERSLEWLTARGYQQRNSP